MKSTYCSGSRSYKLSETGQGREKHGDVTVLFSALSVESGAVRRKGETMNIRKAVDYSTMFADTGICHESRSAADGAVLRDRQGRLCPLGKGCGGSCCGVLERTIPGYDRLLSAQCAPDAGFLAVVQRHAGTAWRSASLELDTERCDHGGRAARRGAPLVHPAGYSTESIQGGASANDRGFCVSGKCSRRKGRCVV